MFLESQWRRSSISDDQSWDTHSTSFLRYTKIRQPAFKEDMGNDVNHLPTQLEARPRRSIQTYLYQPQ